MSSKFRDGQPWWFLPAVAFFLGLFIGWLVIGWGVWPVTYKNALPQDLLAVKQQEYLLMTAESFAASGDMETVRSRLAAWPDDELQQALSTLLERVETVNPLQATQVMLLESALFPGSLPAEGEGTTPAIIPEPSTSSSDTTELLKTACGTALWVLLALGGILGVLYLWRRWRNASQAPGPDIEALTPAPVVRDSGMQQFPETVAFDDDVIEHPLAVPSARQVAPLPVQEAVIYEEVDDFDDELFDEDFDLEAPATEDDEAEIEGEVVLSGVGRQFPRPGLEPEQAKKVAVAAAVASTRGMTKIGEFSPQYDMGISDYNEAFDISDENGAYIGQCALELVDPVGKTHDQAAALQIWMWDKNDPDTKVKVLMSEGAYRDTALRDQLAGGHDVMLIRPGTEFDLRSYNLLLKGVVDKIEYAEQEPVGSIFSEVKMRLAVYLK